MEDVDVHVCITHAETVKEGTRSTIRYWIDVEFGQKKWTIKRRFSQCLEVHKLLEKIFGSKRVPKFPIELKTDSRQSSLSKSTKKQYATDKREKLDEYFRELSVCDDDILQVKRNMI